jgi:hypothetical protein
MGDLEEHWERLCAMMRSDHQKTVASLRMLAERADEMGLADRRRQYAEQLARYTTGPFPWEQKWEPVAG